MRDSMSFRSPRISRRAARSASRGFAARRRAASIARSRTSSGAASALTRPRRSASAPSKSLAEQEILGRLGHPESLWDQQAGAALRRQREIDERHFEARFGAGVDEVAMEEQGGANSDGVAGYGGDERLLEGRRRANEGQRRKCLRARRNNSARSKIAKIGEIIASREISARAGKDDGKRRLVAGRSLRERRSMRDTFRDQGRSSFRAGSSAGAGPRASLETMIFFDIKVSGSARCGELRQSFEGIH